MSLPNQLTLFRLGLIPFLVLFMSLSGLLWQVLALLVLTVAVLTDIWDGRIARRRKQVSDFGKLIDPIADKIMVCGAFICLVNRSELFFPAWPVVIIAGREFLISGLRAVASAHGRIIPAYFAGKLKITVQNTVIFSALITLIIYYYMRGAGKQAAAEAFLDFGRRFVFVALMLAVVVTVMSLWVHMRENLGLLISAMRAATSPASGDATPSSARREDGSRHQ